MQFQDYSILSVRQESLEGYPRSKELAEIGAYCDELQNNTLSCYKCGLVFNIGEINTVMEDTNISFEEAGWLVHTIHQPRCEVLQNLPQQTLKLISGMMHA